MRRTALTTLALAVAVGLGACSSGGGTPPAASSGARATTSSAPAATSSPSSGADPSEASELDRAGAKAFLTLFADGLHRRDRTITQAQVDCIPDAVLDRIAPRELFTLIDQGLGTLSPDQAAQIRAALRACGLTDPQIATANL